MHSACVKDVILQGQSGGIQGVMLPDPGQNRIFFKIVVVQLPDLRIPVNGLPVKILPDGFQGAGADIAVFADKLGPQPVVNKRVDAFFHVRIHHGRAPMVHIPDSLRGRLLAPVRGAVPIGDIGAVLVHHSFGDLVADRHAILPVPCVVKPPAILGLIRVKNLLVLIVAAEQGDARMVPQPFGLIIQFPAAFLGKLLPVVRIGGAGKHEILPQQNPLLVAELIKVLFFV